MKPAASYRVSAPDPRTHLFHVQCVVARPDPEGQVFALPSWIRGSYLVRDFAKHIVQLRAFAGRREVAVERLDKRSFRCAPLAGALRLEYTVYAFDESVRKAYLDLRRGFFNPGSLCYAPVGQEAAPFEIEIRKPPGRRDWKLATSLRAVRTTRDGFGLYAADDYEDLLDHPVEMGAFERIDFKVDGIPHALVLAGRYETDARRIARDLAKICHVERELFHQQPKLKQYLFLTHVTGGGYGGLEHRSSTALICARSDLPKPGDSKIGKSYRTFLGLCSHEYFHLWNVKRITAQSFQDSDLAREAYTRDLWHYEGVTSYYDDHFLLRAGLLDAPTYLDLVAEGATRLARAPSHAVQTLADASFETWIKYYQPDENTPNAAVNYYVKGALAALCLDLTLRLQSKATLDDVMRALWLRFGAQGIGVPEGGLEAVAQDVSGLKLRPFFDLTLRSIAPLPLAELLAEFGVEARPRAQLNDADAGGRVSGETPTSYTGLRLRADGRVAHVLSGSPAEAAGVAGNDQLVALDGLRLTGAGAPGRLASLTPGRTYELLYFRGDELLRGALKPAAPPADTWTLTLQPVRGAVLTRRKKWLGL
jgi:predicted metalloprotease with PDZ domain